MNTDSKRWRACPWLRDLVFHWHELRGQVASDFQRPFSRDWEDLLESAQLTSAESRHECFREATALQAAGLVNLKTARYRPYQIERVIIPFLAEPRLRALFADELPDAPDPKFDFASVQWASPLAFITTGTVTVASDDLLKLNDFLLKQPQTHQIVPIKERSLEIFGDEKRLDALLSTSLFRNGCLDWERDLRCEIIGEPLGWKRGPAAAARQPTIVLENAATWHSYSRWNEATGQFSAVIYGAGYRFVEGVGFLAEIFRELGGSQRVFYFGDLDADGLAIPQGASKRAQKLGFPPIEPHLWSYRQLLSHAFQCSESGGSEPPVATSCAWLGDLAEPARRLFACNQRLAQEHIGWEFLQNQKYVG